MNRVSFVSAWLGLAAIAVSPGIANAAVYNAAAGTGLWSTPGNWASNIIGDNGEFAQINPPAAVNVDGNFNISRLQNSGGSTGGFTLFGAGLLTINTNTAANAVAIRNLTNNASTTTINGNVVINNTNATPGFSQIQLSNSTSNAIVFGSPSNLNLTTRTEVTGVGSVQFNGALQGAGNLRFAQNNVSFGSTSNNAGYSGEMVFGPSANVTANTAAGVSFYGGPKFQFNNSSTLTINNADVVKNAAAVQIAGTSTVVNLNVNANQTFGVVGIGDDILNLTLGALVTDLNFGNSATQDWAGGTLNIVNFTSGVVGFGNINGLTAQQLSQITVDGSAATLVLDSNGKLIIPEPGSMALLGLGATFMIRRKR